MAGGKIPEPPAGAGLQQAPLLQEGGEPGGEGAGGEGGEEEAGQEGGQEASARLAVFDDHPALPGPGDGDDVPHTRGQHGGLPPLHLLPPGHHRRDAGRPDQPAGRLGHQPLHHPGRGPHVDVRFLSQPRPGRVPAVAGRTLLTGGDLPPLPPRGVPGPVRVPLPGHHQD